MFTNCYVIIYSILTLALQAFPQFIWTNEGQSQYHFKTIPPQVEYSRWTIPVPGWHQFFQNHRSLVSGPTETARASVSVAVCALCVCVGCVPRWILFSLTLSVVQVEKWITLQGGKHTHSSLPYTHIHTHTQTCNSHCVAAAGLQKDSHFLSWATLQPRCMNLSHRELPFSLV